MGENVTRRKCIQNKKFLQLNIIKNGQDIWTFLKKEYVYMANKHEKMLNIISNQGNAK